MSDDTRQRVLNAAGPIFAEKGFADATVREICASANTNQAAVNYHFGDKHALYLEVVKLAQTKRMEQVPAAQWPAGTPADEQLRIFIRTSLTRMLETRDLQWPTCLMMREMLQPTIACQALVEEFIRPQLNQLMAILDEFLPEGTPPHRRYQTAFSIIGQCLHYRVAGEIVSLLIPREQLDSEFQVDRLAEHIAEFSLAALNELSKRGRSPAKEQEVPT